MVEGVSRDSHGSSGRRRRRWPIPLLALVAFVLVTRLPALLHPKAIDDEQVYAVVGIEMLHGGQPYLSAVERKPPLLFAVYDAIFRVAGAYNWTAVHLVMVLWTLATMGLLALIARRLFDPATGWWAALLYALFLPWADYRNLALNGELLMNLPVVAALALCFARGRFRWRPELVPAGALVALGFLLKQPAGIAALPLGLYLLLPDYRAARGLSWIHSLAQGALLTLGYLGTFALAAAVLHHEGLLHQALYWSVLSQGSPYGLDNYARNLWKALPLFVVTTLPLLFGTGVSLVQAGRGQGPWPAHRAELTALLLLLAVSVVGVSVNGQFLFHYFIQLLPPLALLAAPAFAALSRGERRAWAWVRRGFVTGWLAVTAVAFLVADTIGLSRNRRPGRSAEYVRVHTGPTDRIFVWGQADAETGFYLDARRRPASRYIASYPLTGHIFSVPWSPTLDEKSRIVPGAWDSLQSDFARHPPRYIIDAEAVRDPVRYPIARYPFLRDYLAAYYRLVWHAPDGLVYARVTD
ncbi:MAG TPA: glycosyltransferase family 39 protein [Gemmatimonadales bacterium]|nr:glycosyltransferase family 39 protein [Gemmatimonadales bacterium]